MEVGAAAREHAARGARQQIQGQLEKAEETRRQAEQRAGRLPRAARRTPATRRNRIIEEARKTADQLRRDIQAKAEQEAQDTVVRAQEEIRAERDRVFQELRAQVGEIAVELAGRVVGKALDKPAHERLIDDYIDAGRLRQRERERAGAAGPIFDKDLVDGVRRGAVRASPRRRARCAAVEDELFAFAKAARAEPAAPRGADRPRAAGREPAGARARHARRPGAPVDRRPARRS